MALPTTTKKLIVMPNALVGAIEAFRAKHNWKSWTYAMIYLINAGLASQGHDIVDATPWGGNRHPETGE